MKPIVHGLEAEYWGRIDFVYIQRDDPNNAEVVQRYGVIYQPVFVLIMPDGVEVQRWFYADAIEFRAAFDANLAAQPDD